MIFRDVVVIGAGAAGCFAAIQAAEHFPNATITILERGIKPLQKVKVSGGGRCNVTNVISDPSELSKNYPRGERFLKKAFYTFSSNEMKSWLEKKGVFLKLYPDGCYFPESNDSQTIIDCFLKEMKRLKIVLNLNERVDEVSQGNNGTWKIISNSNEYISKSVVISIGGQPKESGFSMLKSLDLKMITPFPSLFTFNLPEEKAIVPLMGIVNENTSVKIAGEKWATDGPLLITHWGFSAPAVLKCSAFGARILAEKKYNSAIIVNWTNQFSREEVDAKLWEQKNSQKYISNTPLFSIKSRLWEFLIEKAGIGKEQRWLDLPLKLKNRLFEILVADNYSMSGKTTFKEEFVTAGGVDLSEINVQTMEARRFPGLFFAGEALDIDGITGGFNFQSAWTTAFIAGKSVLLTK